MNKFEYGTRVVHPVHGEGKALNSFDFPSPTVQVLFDNATGVDARIGKHVAESELEKVVEALFTVTVTLTNGEPFTTEPLTQREVAVYVRHIPPMSMYSYTVNRVLSTDEAVDRYFAGYGDEGNIVE